MTEPIFIFGKASIDEAVAKRDEAWREAVEAVRAPVPVTHFDDCARLVYGDSVECDCRYLSKQASGVHHNAALDALLSRMDGAK